MSPLRRAEDKCIIRRLWDKYIPYLASASFITVVSMLVGMAWTGYGFISDSLADHVKIEHQHLVGNLTTARLDRVDGNIVRIMQALKIEPIPKTESEERAEARLDNEKLP